MTECTLCPLHERAEVNCVRYRPAQGKPRVFVVMDRPREDPRPMKLLARSLRELADIDWLTECHRDYAIRCLVPDDVEPTRANVKRCSSEYLLETIATASPSHILLLGNLALQAVTGKSGITRQHGSVWQLEVVPGHTATVMATLSPAAVLKNPKWAAGFGMDIDRFGRIVRGEDTNPKTRITIVNDTASLAELFMHLRDANEISWDIETYTVPADSPYVRTNFQEWHGDDSQIASIAFTWETGQAHVLPLWHPRARWKDPMRILELLRPYMERDDCVYIGHNGKFDSRWMAAKGIRVPQTFDTMLASHMLEENRMKGLKPLARTMLGADAYDVGEELKNACAMPLKRLATYNGKDTDYTFRLYRRFVPLLAAEERSEKVFRKLMMPAADVLVDIERTGVWIDPRRWDERRQQAEQNVARLQAYIDGLAQGSGMDTVNVNAPRQVGRLLFDHLGLPVIERTKTGAASTAEATLLRLEKSHKAAAAIMKWRKWAKYLSTYINPWWYEHKDDDGRIHSNYKLFGTVTGRLSGEGGIQQVPRDPFIRSIIGATPGWTFLVADYSQIELRIAAMLSNERRMLRQYSNGEDIHMIRACRMTGKTADQVEKEERKKAKAVNFGFIYGMGAPKFVKYAFESYGVIVTEAEAQSVREGFFEDYPALRPWHERQRRLANRYHRVASPIGRIRHLPDIMSLDRGVRGEAERQAINSPVQSFASDLMLISLCLLHRKYLSPDTVRIVGTVHDSILFEVKDGHVGEWAPVIKSVMEDMRNVRRMFGTDVTVPIVADIEVGTHWGETEAWHK